MSLTDPIADMFTRIRNAGQEHHFTVDIPSSKIKVAIAALLKREGYILDYEVRPDSKQNILHIKLKYLSDNSNAIESIKRVSKPSVRIYVGKDDIKPVRRYMGIAIISTTNGILTDREAKTKGIGGELIGEVW